MNNNQPIYPLPQHPFLTYPTVPLNPLQSPTMSECLESLERIRCVLMYMLNNRENKKATDYIHSACDKNTDAIKGRSHLISSLHDSLGYLCTQMMAIHKEDKDRIQKQLAELDPIVARLFGCDVSQ